MHVTFVCTGNICRSPIAEKVFAHELALAGLADGVRVSSAGTGGWYAGGPADERASALLRAHGYPHDHIARQVDDDVLSADLIVALDNSHLWMLQSMAPDPDRVRLLSSFNPAAPPGADVIDPFGRDAAAFADVLTVVEAAVPGMLDWVRGHK